MVLLPCTLLPMDMDKKDSVDLLHPLATLEWNQVQCSVPGSGCRNTQCIILNDKFYLATSDKLVPPIYDNFFDGDPSLNVLVAFSLDFKECVKLSVPVEGFALTHYHSQLVLVGGEDPETKEPTNQVLVSADGTDWKPSLPPMREKRRIPSAINTMRPECLVVVGSCDPQPQVLIPHRLWTNTVEVFTNGEWFTVQPHPETELQYPRTFVHQGTLIVVSMLYELTWYSCPVESLLTYCARLRDMNDSLSSCELWEKWESYQHYFCSLVAFGRRLVSVLPKRVEVLCPSTLEWFRAGSLPRYDEEAVFTTSTVLPTGELLVLIQNLKQEITMYKAIVKLLPCHSLDEEFSAAAIERLNAVGFRLYRPLLDNHEEFVTAIGFSDSEHFETLEYMIEKEGEPIFMTNVMDMWTRREDAACRPPTWRSFLDLLKELSLVELSQQISDYLFTDMFFPSLKEQCMAVVTSALLQQTLESDQLHARLPDYIPTTLRDAIVHSFKARTLQLMPKSANPRRYPGYESPSPINDLLPPDPKNIKLT